VQGDFTVYSLSLTCHTATGIHMPYRITRCYLPPDRGVMESGHPAVLSACTVSWVAVSVFVPSHDGLISAAVWKCRYDGSYNKSVLGL